MPKQLKATGRIPDDYIAIQDAIDHPPSDGIIELHTNSAAAAPAKGFEPPAASSFRLGDNEVLYVRKNVTLVGVDDGAKGPRPKRAIIEGVSRLRWGLDPSITDPINPHQVAYVSATVTNIDFRDFKHGMIHMVGGAGTNAITDCSFDNCQYTDQNVSVAGAFPIIVSPKVPTELTGTLSITGCHFGPPSGAPEGGMNNLVHVNDANLTLLDISHNTIEDIFFAGFAVWGVPGHTLISHNRITRKSSYAKTPGAGIVYGIRPASYGKNWDGSVTIEKNEINIQAPPAPTPSNGSYGIAVFRYADDEYGPHAGWPDRQVLVRDNVVRIEGENQIAALACLGACSESCWTGNIVSGSARFGILVTGEPTTFNIKAASAPTNNVFDHNVFAGDTLIDPTNADGSAREFDPFTAFGAQVYVARDASRFSLIANSFGPVSGSNRFDWPPPLNMPCAAGIGCFGSDGQLVFNDFSTSDIQGWWGTPPVPTPTLPGQAVKASLEPHVGCIYLDEMTFRNLVVFSGKDFPPGTVSPSWERQVLDVAKSKWSSPFLSKLLASANVLIEVQKVVPQPPPKPLVQPEEYPEPVYATAQAG